ncbi:MAG: hypothetical protein C0497_10005 [Gemmatimonas sp.]|nr:hypothetical protein [Gemmatimonas sp.]
MTVRALPFVLGFSISVTAWAQDVPSVRRAAAAITAADLRRHVLIFANDSMRWRWTPSPELEVAAQYIAV